MNLSKARAPRPNNYLQALKMLNGSDARTIGYNTYLEKDSWESGTIHVRLHATNIVTFYACTDSVRVNTGGWQTITTRERMNRYLPEGFRVFNSKRVMWMGLPDGTRVEFQDGFLCIPSAGARFAGEVTA